MSLAINRERKGFEDPYASPGIPDYGAFNAFASSAIEGFNTSIGASIYKTTRYAMLGSTGNPVDEPAFNKFYSLGGSLKWHEGMTVEQADYAYRNKTRELETQYRLAGSIDSPADMVLAFAGGFFGNALDPVTLATMAVPIGGGEVKAAHGALKTLARKAAFKGLTKSIFRGSRIATIDAAIWEPFVYFGQKSIQADYGFSDSLVNVGAAAFLGAGLGTVSHVATAHMSRKQMAHLKANFIDAVTDGVNMTGTLKRIDPSLNILKNLDDKLDAVLRGRETLTAEEATDFFDLMMAVDTEDFVSFTPTPLEGKQLGPSNPGGFKIGTLSRVEPVGAKRGESPMRHPEKPLPTMSQDWREYRNLTPRGRGIHKKLRTLVFREAYEKSTDWRLASGKEYAFGRFMKEVFNRELRYFTDGEVFGKGAVFSNEPGTLFLKSGRDVELPHLIGHEFFHSIRHTDPELWSGIVDTILKTDPKFFDKVLEDTAATQSIPFRGAENHWNRLSAGQRVEEAMAEVLGQAFQRPEFWENLRTNLNPTLIQKLRKFLASLLYRLETFFKGEKLNAPKEVLEEIKALQNLARNLANVLGARIAEGPIPVDRFSDGAKDSITARYRKLEHSRINRLLDDNLDKLSRKLGGALDEADEFALEALFEETEALFRYGQGRWQINHVIKPPGGMKNPALYLAALYRRRAESSSTSWSQFPTLYIGDPREGGRAASYSDWRKADHVVFMRHEGGFGTIHENRNLEGEIRGRQLDRLSEAMHAPLQDAEIDAHLPVETVDLEGTKIVVGGARWLRSIDNMKDRNLDVQLKTLREYKLQDSVAYEVIERAQALDTSLEEAFLDVFEPVIRKERTKGLVKAGETFHDASHFENLLGQFLDSDFRVRLKEPFEKLPKSSKPRAKELNKRWTKFINMVLSNPDAFGNYVENPYGLHGLHHQLLTMIERLGSARGENVDIDLSRVPEHELDSVSETGRWLSVQRRLDQMFPGNHPVQKLLWKFTSENWETMKALESGEIMDLGKPQPSVQSLDELVDRQAAAEALRLHFGEDELEANLSASELESLGEEWSFMPDAKKPWKERTKNYFQSLSSAEEVAETNFVALSERVFDRLKERVDVAKGHFQRLRKNTNAKLTGVKDTINLDASTKWVLSQTAISQDVVNKLMYSEDLFNLLKSDSPDLTLKGFKAWIEEARKHAVDLLDDPTPQQSDRLLNDRDFAENYRARLEKRAEALFNETLAHDLWTTARRLVKYEKRTIPEVLEILEERILSRRDSLIHRGIRQQEAESALNDKLSEGYASFMTFLDGHARAGISRRDSVGAKIKANIANDLEPLWKILEVTHMAEEFKSGDIVEEVMAHLEGVPKTKDPLRAKNIARISETIRDVYRSIAGRLNDLGASIHDIDNFSIRQTHNGYLIRKAGKEAWLNDVLSMIDGDTTMKYHGDISPVYLHADGTAEVFPSGDLGAYLSKVYDDLVAGHPREAIEALDQVSLFEHGGALANQLSHQRKLFFKPGEYYNYLKKYSNPNSQNEIFQQLQHLSHTATLMDAFGPNYAESIDTVLAAFNGKPEATRFQKWLLKNTLLKMTGELDHPANRKIAEVGQTIRAFANAAFLGQATITALQDVSTVVSRLHWQGMTHGQAMTEFTMSLSQAMKRHGEEGSSYFLGMGAGVDSLLGSVARRFTGETFGANFAKKLNDWTFKWNGMNFWNTVAQEAVIDVATRHFGNMARQSTLTPEFVSALAKFGISEADFRAAAVHMEGGRLSPDMLPSNMSRVSESMRVMLVDTMNEAILLPTASEEALTSLGTRAGTYTGEAVRIIMQYKTFPLALTRKVYRRLFNAFGEDAMQSWGASGFRGSHVDALVFLASAVAMAMLTFNIKEITKGREPLTFLEPDQWKSGNVLRVLKSSGILGIGDEIIYADYDSFLGPMGGQIANLLASMGDSYQFANAAASLAPGATLPFVNEGKKALLAAILGDAFAQQYALSREWKVTSTGQEDL